MKFFDKYDAYWDLAGRALLAALFVFSGVGKIGNYAGTAGYMDAAGVPGGLLPLVILTEIGCGLGMLIGYQTRLAAFLLAGYTLLAALLFHQFWHDSGQMIDFVKNIAIVGGLLVLLRNGAGPWSMDARKA